MNIGTPKLTESEISSPKAKGDNVMKTTGKLLILALGGAIAFGGTTAFAAGDEAGDPVNGLRMFNRCKACHTVTNGGRKMGPHLQCLFGRTAGEVEDFSKYSNAMKSANFKWGHETLEVFLSKPNDLVPGTSMRFPGFHNHQQLDDLMAYLEEATEAPSCVVSDLEVEVAGE